MKYFLFLLSLTFWQTISQAQSSLVNLKVGTWKNAQTWLYQRIPSDTDNVVLMRDIVVDTNAFCRSLTSNGYNITVADGFHLTIVGKDTTTGVDIDTLVSAITIIYQGGGTIKDTLNSGYRRYEYDSLKRLSRVLENSGNNSNIKTTTYFYSGNTNVPIKAFSFNPCDLRSNNVCYPRHDTTFYTYSDEGVVVKEVSLSRYSEYQLNYKRTNDYFIQTDSVFKYAEYNSFVIKRLNENGDLEITENYKKDTTRFYRLMENGNIVKQFDTSSSKTDRYVRKYDKNKNPLYRTSIHLPVFPMEMLLFQDPEQNNNVLTSEETYKVGLTNFFASFRKFYKYKANGYPSELFLPNYNGPNTLAILKFHYTK